MFKLKNLKWLVILATIFVLWSTIKAMESSSANHKVLSMRSSEQTPSNKILLPYKANPELPYNLQKEKNSQNKASLLIEIQQHKRNEPRLLLNTHQQTYIPPEKRKEGYLGIPPTPEMVFASPDGKL